MENNKKGCWFFEYWRERGLEPTYIMAVDFEYIIYTDSVILAPQRLCEAASAPMLLLASSAGSACALAAFVQALMT